MMPLFWLVFLMLSLYNSDLLRAFWEYDYEEMLLKTNVSLNSNCRRIYWSYITLILSFLLSFKSMILSFVFFVVLFKYPYFKLKRKTKEMETQMLLQFPIWLSEIQIQLQNNTIINALEKSIEVTNGIFKYYLIQFVNKVKKDPEDVILFESFLYDFELPLMKDVMLLLYEFQYLATDDLVKNFDLLSNLSYEILNESEVVWKEKVFNFQMVIAYVPMVLLSFFFLFMLFLLLTNMVKGGIS